MKKVFLLMVGAAFILSACGGKSYTSGGVKYKVKKDKVVEASYGSRTTAKYFYKKPHVKKNKNFYVTGAVDVPGDSAPTRCEIASDLQAKMELASELNTRMENQLQYSSEGFSIDQQSLNQIATQSTKVEMLQGIYIDTRFWEKKIVRNGPDTYVKYTCYSRAVMPMKAFEEHTDRLLKEYEGKNKLSPEFQQKVDASWDRFFKPVDVDDNKEYAIEYLENIQ
ncbi:MAG: hypothetical protein COV46_04145 [Deltaproteobacteria bacterium CG11_big_fil_rev_8_21_14_0_20_49_13]|nr:MAG: hypothetical protein COV46_04145 [Deltaproteobacteria bacterium CG11_big_fil_rev_8_21_14_0_20_49_13]